MHISMLFDCDIAELVCSKHSSAEVCIGDMGVTLAAPRCLEYTSSQH